MHSNANRKREGIKSVWGVPPLLLGGFWHTPHTYYVDIKFLVCWRCLTLPQPHDCSTISAVKLSYRDRNGTGRTLDAKTTNTNPFETNHPHTPLGVQTACCVKHCTTNTNTIIILLFAANTCSWRITALLNCPHTGCFLCRYISTSHLQHVTMLTALAYQPHHL